MLLWRDYETTYSTEQYYMKQKIVEVSFSL